MIPFGNIWKDLTIVLLRPQKDCSYDFSYVKQPALFFVGFNHLLWVMRKGKKF